MSDKKEKNLDIIEKSDETYKDKKGGFQGWMKEHKLMAIIIIAFAALLIYRIGAFVINTTGTETENEKLTAVTLAVAENVNISKATLMSGRISAVEEAAIYPLAQGQITAVHVKVGDYVKKGATIFNIDSGMVSGSLTQAKTAYDVASTSYNNMAILYKEGAISKSDFDAAKVQYQNAKSAYQLAAEQMSNYNVTAPISGYITSLNVSVGNMANSAQMAASISNTSELQIETTASEYVAGLLHVGDEVEVTVTNLEGKVFKGEVDTLSPAPALGTYTYPVSISLDNSKGELMSGMFAEVSVKAEQSRNALCVPTKAVIMKNGKSVVAVVDDKNIARFREVKTGIDNGEMIEIIGGVNPGEKVAVTGQDFVEDGAKVKVNE